MTDISLDAAPTRGGSPFVTDEIWEAIRRVTQLLLPDDPVPIVKRLEQFGLSDLGQIIGEQQEQIAVQQQRIALLTAQTTNQQMALERLQSDVGRLLACVDMQGCSTLYTTERIG